MGYLARVDWSCCSASCNWAIIESRFHNSVFNSLQYSDFVSATCRYEQEINHHNTKTGPKRPSSSLHTDMLLYRQRELTAGSLYAFLALAQESILNLQIFSSVIPDPMHMANYCMVSVDVAHLLLVLKSHFQVFNISFHHLQLHKISMWSSDFRIGCSLETRFHPGEMITPIKRIQLQLY